MAERVRVVDTTLRDGQMSLWATNMRTGMILPVAEAFDAAGFDAIELVGMAFFKKCVRDLHEDPWERIRRVSECVRHTPLRAIKTRHIASFQATPPSISAFWMRRLAVHGIRQVRISDPTNTVANLKQQARVARSAGMDVIANLIFSVSPKHTDAYYAERAEALADVEAMRLCLKDPGGLLTPERTRTLLAALSSAARGRPIELHSHCNAGLGSLNAVVALAEGVRIVNTAVPPLADGASLPSVFTFVENARSLGYETDLDPQPLREIEAHFRRIARRDGLPVGVPSDYDEYQRRHQVPGGMISNFRLQLRNLGMADRLPDVLDETIRVRADLGYPIMVTPYSQFVGSQAAINVILGERYKEVTDELIRYALGEWGEEEAGAIVPDVRDRILGRSRATELAAQRSEDLTVTDLRRQLDAGASVDDDELLLRYLTSPDDVEAMRRAGPAAPDRAGERPLLELLSGIASSRVWSAYVEKGDFRLRMRRRECGPEPRIR